MDDREPVLQDPQEWTALVGQESGWLRRYVARHVPGAAVDDVLQEVWLSWWRFRDRYHEEGRRRVFLRRVAERRIADWYRSRRRDDRLEPVAVAPSDPDVIARELKSCGSNREAFSGVGSSMTGVSPT